MYTLSLHDALPISTGSMRHDRIALRQTPEPPLQQQMPPSRTRLDPAIERPTHRASAKPCRPHPPRDSRSEEHTSELQSHSDLVCRLLLEKKKTSTYPSMATQGRQLSHSNSSCDATLSSAPSLKSAVETWTVAAAAVRFVSSKHLVPDVRA